MHAYMNILSEEGDGWEMEGPNHWNTGVCTPIVFKGTEINVETRVFSPAMNDDRCAKIPLFFM